MQTLYIIFTRHRDDGNCNSKELLKIIEDINPEIIFEELEKEMHVRIYKDKKQTTLETNAIKEYIKKQDIPHIPVDTFSRPLNFFKDCGKMRSKIAGIASQDAFDYKNYIDQLALIERKYGFDFLNSDNNDKLLEEIDSAKERVLKAIGDEKLHQISCMEKEINEKREDEILNNIYNYSKDHSFNQAILFIGAGHRKSMLKKIEKRNKIETVKIYWKLLNQ